MDPMKNSKSDTSDSSNANERLLKDIYRGGSTLSVAEGNNHQSNGGPKYYRGDLLEKGMFTLYPFSRRNSKRANSIDVDLDANNFGLD